MEELISSNLMEYNTYIFEESKKKIMAERMNTLSIIGVILFCMFLWYLGVPGIGIFASASIGIALFKYKEDENKKRGVRAYGSKKAKITIAEDHLIINETLIPMSELKDLIIYVDEYTGMPKQPIGTYHGGNNEITFNHKGKSFSFNYWIKDKQDYRYVEKLVNLIESTTKPNLHLK